MVKPYQRKDTIADVGILSSGADIKELFSNTAKGLFSLIVPLRSIRKTEGYQVKVIAEPIEELLVAWINELIFIHGVKRLLFRSFDITKLEDTSLEALCFGESINTERHCLNMEVKAATYHKLSIWKDLHGLWRAQIILDV